MTKDENRQLGELFALYQQVNMLLVAMTLKLLMDRKLLAPDQLAGEMAALAALFPLPPTEPPQSAPSPDADVPRLLRVALADLHQRLSSYF